MRMRTVLLTISVFMIFIVPLQAQLDDKVADRLFESATVLDELVNAPDAGIPKELLHRAECVAVIPATKKAAFGVGGNYGRGVVGCRKDGGKGPWGAPSMIMLSGGSFLRLRR